DRAYGKSFLLEDANLDRLRCFILERAYYWRGRRDHKCRSEDGRVIDVLVIVQLDVQKALLALFADRVPDNVAFEHYNDIRGLDFYRDVPCGIFAGRTKPSNAALELMREALDYDNPEIVEYIPAQGEYEVGRRTILMADGTAVSIPCERHPDDRVELLRQQKV